MSQLKKSLLTLGAAAAVGGLIAACPLPATAGGHKANPCKAAANPCKANPCKAAANPCKANPCKANPCKAAANPCKANPCKANPCKAAANPCKANPCKANPCGPCKANPCGPCGAAKAATLTDGQAAKLYKALASKLAAGYAKSGNKNAKRYLKWKKYNTVPYQSETHGKRYVNNYANRKARNYRKYKGDLILPVGSIVAKDSIQAQPGGKAAPGPFFLMEKMRKGWNKPSADWRYSLIMPTGAVIGVTKGKGDKAVAFCAQCHQAAGKSQMFFLPEKYRAK